ncbi:MAG: BadF/BadG/BcrA/BcrD ATPase family protein [Acidobacteriota bacterium]
MPFILAIDGGASRTRCLATSKTGHVLGKGEGGPSNHLLAGRETVVRSLREAIDQVLATAGLRTSHVACVSAGLAGIDYDGLGAEEAGAIFAEIGFPGALLNSDMVIAHAGALAGGPGVIALSGTGSVVYGSDKEGRRVRVGGWGPVYGNEGSGSAIGRMGLTAAARAQDGRGPDSALEAAMCEALGISQFRESIVRIYQGQTDSSTVAALSRVVDRVAQEGDTVARGILLQAGEQMAEQVATAIRKLNLGDTPRVSYQGAVLESCSLMRERFISALKEEFRQVEVIKPRFEPIIGACLLGRARLGWPLDEAVLQALGMCGKGRP